MNPKYASLLALILLLAQAAYAQSLRTWKDPSPHTISFAKIDSLQLQYLDWGGTGDVLLFLPGLGQSAHIFDGLAPHFTNSCHVMALTRRGQGKSSRPESGYDTATLVQDVKEFIDSKGIESVILAGHSMAGNELTEFARRYPSRVKRIIYIEAAYDYGKMPTDDPIKIEQPSPSEMASIDAGMHWFERVFGFSSPAIEADARDVNVKPDGTITMESGPSEIVAQLWKGMISYSPSYESIRAPILAFYAVSESHPFLKSTSSAADQEKGNTFWRTKFVPYQRQSMDELLRSRAPVHIVILRNTKHLCFIEKRDEAQVIEAIQNFLRSGQETPKLTDF